MSAFSVALRGTTVYEFRMAARQRVLWLAVLPLLAVCTLIAGTSERVLGLSDPTGRVGAVAVVLNAFCTPGIAVALTDRLRQARRPGLAELLAATPTGPVARGVGLLAGSLAVALAPVALVLLSFGVGVTVAAGSVGPITAAVLGALVVLLPGALALTALASALGLVFSLPLARILTVLVWVWTTLLSPRILPMPNATGTMLSPLGEYPATVWLHTKPWFENAVSGTLSPTADPAAAVTNLLLVLACAALLFGMAVAAARVSRETETKK
jgi:ABC-2 type transport system permease protein